MVKHGISMEFSPVDVKFDLIFATRHFLCSNCASNAVQQKERNNNVDNLLLDIKFHCN